MLDLYCRSFMICVQACSWQCLEQMSRLWLIVGVVENMAKDLKSLLVTMLIYGSSLLLLSSDLKILKVGNLEDTYFRCFTIMVPSLERVCFWSQCIWSRRVAVMRSWSFGLDVWSWYWRYILTPKPWIFSKPSSWRIDKIRTYQYHFSLSLKTAAPLSRCSQLTELDFLCSVVPFDLWAGWQIFLRLRLCVDSPQNQRPRVESYGVHTNLIQLQQRLKILTFTEFLGDMFALQTKVDYWQCETKKTRE